MKVAIRTDASLAIGTGHVMRCLTLAETLRRHGCDILFVSREHEGHLHDLIEKQGFGLSRLAARRSDGRPVPSDPEHAAWLGTGWQEDAEDSLSALNAFRPDWLIVDHYGLDARWESRLRSRCGRILVIDDLADRPHDCDLLLDQNLEGRKEDRYVGKVPERCVVLLGPAYALLQPAYAELHALAQPRKGAIQQLLVFYGGVDTNGFTLKTVEALIERNLSDVTVDVVLSASSPQYREVERLFAGRENLRLHDRLPTLAPLMLEADLAIGAGGATNWERLCLGLPSLVIAVAENQRRVVEELSRRGLVRWLGDSRTADKALIGEALEELLAKGLDGSWSERCFEVTDGRGTDRVSAVMTARRAMPIVIRHANAGDEALLFEWASDPAARLNARQPGAVQRDEHRAWLQARLRDTEGCKLCIAETECGMPLGMVRFDRHGCDWEVSYALSSPFRGQGIGRTMLSAAIDYLKQTQHIGRLFGWVKPDNTASRKTLESLDFSIREDGSDCCNYERLIEN